MHKKKKKNILQLKLEAKVYSIWETNLKLWQNTAQRTQKTSTDGSSKSPKKKKNIHDGLTRWYMMSNLKPI